jgi:O-antigen ligase
MKSSKDVASRSARAAWILLAFVLLFTMWVWAGSRPSLHGVAVAAAGILAVVVLAGGGRDVARAWCRDPVFWFGLLFLAYLIVPWLNAGRTLYYDVGFQRWQYTPPPWPSWPSAFSRAEATQVWQWFFTAWVLVMTVRSPLLDRKALLRLLQVVVLGAGLLAVFGLLQFLAGTRSIYGLTPLSCVFFASFSYANHAAAFFLLAGALAAGLLFREFLRAGRPVLRGGAGVWAAVLAVCLAGACLSLSRAGVVLAAVLGLGVLGLGWRLGRRAFSRVDRVHYAAGAAAALLLTAVGVAGVGERLIRREFTTTVASSAGGALNLSLSGRPDFVRAAWAMWKDHPWWGVGSAGYRYLVSAYLPPGRMADLEKRGWANVHCDALQFLVEFGLVGCTALSGGLAFLVVPALKVVRAGHPLCTMAWFGLALVLVFSLIDLPFRCPAILYTWSVTLAALPRVCSPQAA